MAWMQGDPEALIREFTRVQPLAFVPEVQLYLADELVPLWQATEWRSMGPEQPPFWAFAWPGSQALARYVFDAADCVRGKRVLDLGSGSGLAAIASAKCGAREVTACDVDPLAAVAQRLNFTLNDVHVMSLTIDAVGLHQDFDVILAGDVCYEREPAEATLTWLRCKAQDTLVLLADPGRHYAPSDGLDLLVTYDVPVLRELESVDLKRTRLWQLR